MTAHRRMPNNYLSDWSGGLGSDWVDVLGDEIPTPGTDLVYTGMSNKTVMLMPRFVIGAGVSFEVVVETQVTGTFATGGYHAVALYNGNCNYFGGYFGELPSDEWYYHDFAYADATVYNELGIFWASGQTWSFKLTYDATEGATKLYLSQRIGGVLEAYTLYATRPDGPARGWAEPLSLWIVTHLFTGSFSIKPVSITRDGDVVALGGAYDDYVWGGYSNQDRWAVWPTFPPGITVVPDGVHYHWRDTAPEGATEPGGIMVAYDETDEEVVTTQVGSETVVGGSIPSGSDRFQSLKLYGKQNGLVSRTRVRVVDPLDSNALVTGIPSNSFGDNVEGFYPASGFFVADVVDLSAITQTEIALEVTSSNTDGTSELTSYGNGFDGWLTVLYGFMAEGAPAPIPLPSDSVEVTPSISDAQLVGILAADSGYSAPNITTSELVGVLGADSVDITPTASNADLVGVLTAESVSVFPTVSAAELIGVLTAADVVVAPAITLAELQPATLTGSGSIRSPSGATVAQYLADGRPVTNYRYIDGMWQ
jgi:hypothetical protein